MSGFDPGWLALRAPADAEARAASAPAVVVPLAEHLRGRGRTGGGADLLDVGAGTGSGARWLQGFLAGPARWRLVDHDATLLDLAVREGLGDGAQAAAVRASVTDLPAVLAGHPADAVTCQALLDLLRPAELDALLDAAAGCGAAVLLALTVTGQVELSPAHPLDGAVAAAFDAHQRREGRLGPDAAAAAEDGLRRRGYTVTAAPSPWRLGPGEARLAGAWVDGRAAAAAEQDPGLATQAGRWRDARREQVARGELHVVVEHLDVLGLPPSPGTTP